MQIPDPGCNPSEPPAAAAQWRRRYDDAAAVPVARRPCEMIASSARAAVTSGGGCGGDRGRASCDDDDGSEACGVWRSCSPLSSSPQPPPPPSLPLARDQPYDATRARVRGRFARCGGRRLRRRHHVITLPRARRRRERRETSDNVKAHARRVFFVWVVRSVCRRGGVILVKLAASYFSALREACFAVMVTAPVVVAWLWRALRREVVWRALLGIHNRVMEVSVSRR